MRSSYRKSLFCVVILLLAISFSTPAGATVSDAKSTAYDIARTFELIGYNVRETFKYGLLLRGTSYTTSTTLYQGSTYVFIAGGDRNAFNIDIRVYDENGEIVAKAADETDTAVARVTPRWTGTFYIKIMMAEAPPQGAYWVLVTGQHPSPKPPTDPEDYFKAKWVSPKTQQEIEEYFRPVLITPQGQIERDRYGRTKYTAAAVIHFDEGKYTIKAESLPLLDEWGKALKKLLSKGIFMVEGHTDSTGSAKTNWELSERRAMSVVMYLINKHNIPSDRLVPRGFGQRFPVADNATADGRAQNRRVQFTLVKWLN